MIIKTFYYSQEKQQGVALVIGLLLLFVVTLIAISGLTNAALQTKVATSVQQHNTTFQTAESALSRAIVAIEGIPLSGVDGDASMLSTSMASGSGVKNVAMDTTLSIAPITVTIAYTHRQSSSLAAGISLTADDNSTLIGANKFVLESNATLTGAGAASTVSEGITYE